MGYQKSICTLFALVAMPVQARASVAFGDVQCWISATDTYASLRTFSFGELGCASGLNYASVYIGRFDVSASSNLEATIRPNEATIAFSYFRDDVILTITGGSGDGLFVPIVLTTAAGSAGSNAGATFRFGPLTCSTVSGGCGSLTAVPFTFNVPQTFLVELLAFADAADFGGAASANLSFRGLQVLSPAGDYTYALVGTDLIPEPATLLTGALGLALVGMGRRFSFR